MEQFKFSKVRDVKSPTRANSTDAGVDLYIHNDWNNGEIYRLQPHTDILIPSGIHVSVPKNHAFIAFNKSGVATKLKLGHGAEVVDEPYQGEIHIHMINHSEYPVELVAGMKIVQFIFIPVSYFQPCEVPFEDLYREKSSRGADGFGSTDHK